jgi:methylmalonyl-CoA mutase
MKHLFTDFDPVSAKEWKQKIQFELKGADYNDTLIWNSPEDIKVKPFYDKEDIKEVLSVATKASEFKICQNIFVHDLNKSVERALDSLSRGAESIRFTIEDETVDVTKLLEKLPLGDTPIFFHLSFISTDFVQQLDTIAKAKKATIYCNFDPIGQLAKDGNWFTTSEKSNFDTLNILTKQAKSLSLISVNSTLYQNAGANIVQQIAYTLAHANEFFNHIFVSYTFIYAFTNFHQVYFWGLQNFYSRNKYILRSV